MISNSKKSGFLATIKAAEAANTARSATTDTTINNNSSSTSIESLFKEGTAISEDALRKMLDRYDEDSDDLSKPQTKFPINLKVSLLSLSLSPSSLLS
jgi:hypothetical protein